MLLPGAKAFTNEYRNITNNAINKALRKRWLPQPPYAHTRQEVWYGKNKGFIKKSGRNNYYYNAGYSVCRPDYAGLFQVCAQQSADME